MKKLFTFLVAASFVATSFGQIFQSNLSSWSGGDPTDFMGSATSIASSSVVEVTAGANYGTSMAALINAGTSHKRFTTKSLAVTAGSTYEIKFWISGATGDIRTNYYNVTSASWGTYNSYVTVTSTQTMVTQTVTLAATCDSAQFIISLRNTDATGIFLDSVSITSGSAPVGTPVTINDIQYTTNSPADSPYNTQLIETSGVVTAVINNGYYLQDGAGAFNGVFVLDYTNTPSMGDMVTVTGTVDEYFNFTEIKNVLVYVVSSSGNALPTPLNLTAATFNTEGNEGVLVKVVNETCNEDTTSNNFEEWRMANGTDTVVVRGGIYPYNPIVGTNYDVTGVVEYNFGNFKILPRMTSDISVATGIEKLNDVTVSVYPNPVTNSINFELDLTRFNVKIIDVTGKTIKNINSMNSKLTISTSDINNGIYFYSISDIDGNIIATNRFVVAK